MMDRTQIVRDLRKKFNIPVFALLIFYAIMNLSVVLTMLAQAAILFLQFSGQGDVTQLQQVLEQITESTYSNGWGYVLAYLVGAALLLWWKKPSFLFGQIWKRNGAMSVSKLLIFLCFTTAAQALYESFSQWIYSFFELFGLEYNNSAVTDAMDFSSVSLVLYMCILAPIGEEILFRGLVLRSLSAYGRKFSILASAVLFGLFHGNLEQGVFAFAIGLLLGYVTVEYSLAWSVVLHMFNNLILCYILPLILSPLSPFVGEFVMTILIWGCATVSALILLVKRYEVAEFMLRKRIHPLCIKSFFTAPAVIVFNILMLGNIVLVFILQLL